MLDYRAIKKIGSILYRYISLSIYLMWMIYIKLKKKEIIKFDMLPLERLSRAQPCSSVSCEQNGYYAVHNLLRSWVLVPKISWSHILWLFLRKKISLCATSTNNFGWPKKSYHNCGELSDARHPSSGMGWIQLPSWCCPCGRRGTHWTSINFIASIIKYTSHHICHCLYVLYRLKENWIHIF
jgi:hypothetical protein